MGKTKFTVEGKPKGKGRPRFYGGRVITPKDTVEYEKRVAEAYRETGCSGWHDGQALSMWVTAYFEVPKSYTKKRKKLIDDGLEHYTKKPDIDNIVKIVMDGLMRGEAFGDDSQIVHISATKLYGEERVEVVIGDY